MCVWVAYACGCVCFCVYIYECALGCLREGEREGKRGRGTGVSGGAALCSSGRLKLTARLPRAACVPAAVSHICIQEH